MDTHSRDLGALLFRVNRSKEVGEVSGDVEFLCVDFLRFLALITHLEESLSDTCCRSRQE